MEWLLNIDRTLAELAARSLIVCGVYILISGFDDLVVDVLWMWRCLLHRLPEMPPPVPERAIAIYLPLWQEAEVIEQMLNHNFSVIGYSNYEVFAGVYPNDTRTRQAVVSLQSRYPRLHLAEVPHPGPTNKADCLNWIYQRMLLHEESTGRRFDLVMVHDAEDLIHPRSLDLINRYSRSCDMIQVPVLALPTPWQEFTHGLYCDDFAESQGKDLFTRVSVGAFLPGCGVGTGFTRQALERLACAESNRIFSPASLTEDYDNGLRLYQLGCRQIFLPLHEDRGSYVATREYFPRKAAQAVRQRSRWVTGNALQAWERFGWGAGLPHRWAQIWFLWRDRKGLWGNPISLFCNLLLVYGVLSWLAHTLNGTVWPLHERLMAWPLAIPLVWCTGALLLERTIARCSIVASLYGVPFALGVPIRMFWGNWINTRATLTSVATWLRSRWRREALVWLKTDHAYPTRGTLSSHKRKLGEILVAHGYSTQADVERALKTQPEGTLLGRHMVALGSLTEVGLYEALGLQQSLPCVTIDPSKVPQRVARSLPARLAREWHVLPFRVSAGSLDVASPQVPTDELMAVLQRFTRLDIRFHLVTPSHFAVITRHLLH